MNSRNNQIGKRPQKKIILLFTEGTDCEPQYFKEISTLQNTVSFDLKHNLAKSKKRNPAALVTIANNVEARRSYNEIWIVHDKDSWTAEQFKKVETWKSKSKIHKSAVSVPKFEYWLLLHFEDGNKTNTSQEVDRKLRKYMPKYDKKIPAGQFSLDQVKTAISRSQIRNKNTNGMNGHSKSEIGELLSQYFL